MNKRGQWLIVSLHDERYDFNLNIKSFKGNLSELADEEMINVEDIKPYRDGWYQYHSEFRVPLSEFTDVELCTTKKLEEVRFNTVLCIPLEDINWSDLCLQHPVVNRNMKFGFLDLKE